MYVQTSRKFLCVLTVSVFGSSCENSAICCVHPVLWRTSRYGNYQFRGIPVRFHGAPATASAKLPLVGSWISGRELILAMTTCGLLSVVCGVHYPPTVILTIICIPLPTHSFFPGLKPPFSANPSYSSVSFFSSGFTTWILQTVYCYFLAFLFSTFQFFCF